MSQPPFYIGLMSGTSLDGVDGVLTTFSGQQQMATVPFPDPLKHELMALQSAGANEIHREAMAANALVALYAACVHALLHSAHISAAQVRAIGAHGQTIRHLPASGYTRQINNPALLAELTGIDVIADFRSRDVAAGGQGAPLVPAFHQAVFGSNTETRVVANIGGISNISILKSDGSVTGFDTGPGNLLMDGWINQHQGAAFDEDGRWAASGTPDAALLQALLAEPFFAEDVQATLTAFTATSLADAIRRSAADAAGVYVCGGGARNTYLMRLLQEALTMPVAPTDALGVAPGAVEGLAFAWLAARFCDRLPGNLPAVTGARGSRILGALYPA